MVDNKMIWTKVDEINGIDFGMWIQHRWIGGKILWQQRHNWEGVPKYKQHDLFVVSKDGLFSVAITVRLSTYKIFYYHCILQKYFISIYITYYLYAASSSAYNLSN